MIVAGGPRQAIVAGAQRLQSPRRPQSPPKVPRVGVPGMTGQVVGAGVVVRVVASTVISVRRETMDGGGSWNWTVKLIRSTLKQIRIRLMCAVVPLVEIVSLLRLALRHGQVKKSCWLMI